MSAAKWIKWEGGPCPLPVGTLVDLHFDCGDVLYGVTVGSDFHDRDGNPFGDPETNRRLQGSSWTRAHRYHPDGGMIAWVIAYRLHDPEDAEEQIRRAERLERFNEIARRAPLDMPHPEPEPAPFRRREPVNPPCGHRSGLQPVSGAVARQMRRIAREARDHWSRHLATDMTPAERAEAHAFIRELTRIIDGGPL